MAIERENEKNIKTNDDDKGGIERKIRLQEKQRRENEREK
jgi:hypothetical protein